MTILARYNLVEKIPRILGIHLAFCQKSHHRIPVSLDEFVVLCIGQRDCQSQTLDLHLSLFFVGSSSLRKQQMVLKGKIPTEIALYICNLVYDSLSFGCHQKFILRLVKHFLVSPENK